MKNSTKVSYVLMDNRGKHDPHAGSTLEEVTALRDYYHDPESGANGKSFAELEGRTFTVCKVTKTVTIEPLTSSPE